jgi:hypothetical protein
MGKKGIDKKKRSARNRKNRSNPTRILWAHMLHQMQYLEANSF